MARQLVRRGALTLALAFAAGCQGILGIEEGTLRDNSTGGAASGAGGTAAGGTAAGGNPVGTGGDGTSSGGASGGAPGAGGDGAADSGAGGDGAADSGAGGDGAGGAATGGAGGDPGDGGLPDAEVESGAGGAGSEPDAEGGSTPPSVVINEVESNGGTPGDWVELYNPGSSSVDVSGYVFSDSNDGSRYALPVGSVIAAGGYLVLEEATFGFGLGSADTARLLATDGTTVVDFYAWTSHAFTTYGACPDGSGALVTTSASTKGAANDCSPNVLVSEVESNGGTPGDWIELYNTGLAPADVAGWILRDDDDTHEYAIPAGTVIAPGRFVAFEEAALGFALGSADSVRLFFPGGTTLVDRHDWTAHAATTYGRCPAAGPFTTTAASTKAAPNDCGNASDVEVWPGTNATTAVDVQDALEDNLSGLAFEAGASAADDVLWAVRNDPAVLHRLKFDGSAWVPDTAGGWADGKELRYPGGLGVPDAEGVTRADWSSPEVYVVAERDNADNQVSRSSVLQLTSTDVATTLVATMEWNLTAGMPASDPNRGLEGIAWIPDAFLTSRGFHDERLAKTYDPADYAGHGTGLFVVGFEATGSLYAYALEASGSAERVATITSGSPSVNALEFDRDVGYLWTYCGATCANVATVLDIDTGAASPTRGRFVVRASFLGPSTLNSLANEGIAFATEARCTGGEKAFFWADDDATGGRALRRDTIPCGSFLP